MDHSTHQCLPARYRRHLALGLLLLAAAALISRLSAAPTDRPTARTSSAGNDNKPAPHHAANKPATTGLKVACAETARRLKSRLGGACSVIERPPFVLGGNLSIKQLGEWHAQTVEPAAKAMANCYFKTPPREPITVLLFPDQASYADYAERLFKDRDVSIYGYYKPAERTLVMNIGTGGGTLVHELTHALIAWDFPAVPDWFNEGLASLHEQCRFRDGENEAEERSESGPWIEGLENWRLPGLQSAIRAGKLKSLEALVNDQKFRGAHEGTNYAQARYFCLYMQRQGVLRDFYRRFRDARRDDPRGAKTVLAVFPDRTWAELDEEFQAWALTLERPK